MAFPRGSQPSVNIKMTSEIILLPQSLNIYFVSWELFHYILASIHVFYCDMLQPFWNTFDHSKKHKLDFHSKHQSTNSIIWVVPYNLSRRNSVKFVRYIFIYSFVVWPRNVTYLRRNLTDLILYFFSVTACATIFNLITFRFRTSN